MTNTRNEFILKAKNKLDMINSKIFELEAKANDKTGEASREVKEKLNGIRESSAQAKRRLEELHLASKPAWEDAKQGVEKAWHLLSDAVDRATERVQ